MNIIISEGLDYAIGIDIITKRKILIRDDDTMNHMVSKYEINMVDFQTADEPFYKYNYHDQFREFGVSKRDLFKTIRIRRKR